jgi:hypothetical protein
MRVGSLRQAPVAILQKAAAVVGIGLDERAAQLDCQPAPAGRLAERPLPAGIGQQRKGLIVEIEGRIADPPVELHHRHHRRIRRDEAVAEIGERVQRRLAPGPVPSEAACLAIGKRLAGDAARPVRPRQRSAVERDRLVEAAADAVGTHVPPQRQRHIEQPASQRRRLLRRAAHAAWLRRARSAADEGMQGHC